MNNTFTNTETTIIINLKKRFGKESYDVGEITVTNECHISGKLYPKYDPNKYFIFDIYGNDVFVYTIISGQMTAKHFDLKSFKNDFKSLNHDLTKREIKKTLKCLMTAQCIKYNKEVSVNG